MKRKIAKRIDADLQLVADVEALMHGIAGLARLDGVADHVDFRHERLELFGQRIVLAGAEAEDNVVKALEPLFRAILVLDLDLVLGHFEHLGVDVALNALAAQAGERNVAVRQADAGHELRLHLHERDFHVADAAGGGKGVRTRVGHEHFGRLAGDFAAAEDADRALRDW